MNDDGLKTIFGFIATSIVIAGGLFVLMAYSNKYECNKYNEATGRETKLVAQTCYTKVQGEWYPVGQVRAIK